MAGIYIHIPFCKQACHYCDFHFSTSTKQQGNMLQAIHKELHLRREYLKTEPIQTIYFGGGSPSLLAVEDIQQLIAHIYALYPIVAHPEITLEANPDDLTTKKVQELKHNTPINRFSIGIQSFHDEDLRWMNRAHNADEAQTVIALVQDAGFENITADLIYGYPMLSDTKWEHNIDMLISSGIPHISAYSMTVEPRTALADFIRKGKQTPMNEGQSARQFETLVDGLSTAGFEQYEISNFAKSGHYAVHNTNYWKGVHYLGVGPSAHSFDGISRQWNINNNMAYIKALQQEQIPYEHELLSANDQLNEYIMTALRTQWGIDLLLVAERFGTAQQKMLLANINTFIRRGEAVQQENHLVLTTAGKLLADHIASELFFA